jgi:1-deoxy-D-xylulose-5-phosphate synthase
MAMTLDALVNALDEVRNASGPQFLHVVTRKGHGLRLAEADPVAYHGPGKFDRGVGLKPRPRRQSRPSPDVLWPVAVRYGRVRPQTGRHYPGHARRFRHGGVSTARYPDRFYDVGIAEQHALTFAAGLACEGLRPVVAIYSTFLQRAYDQLIHDVALQKLPMVLALDRAGIVGADGATHAGRF